MKRPWCVLPFIHMYASDPKWDDKVCCVATKYIKTYKDSLDTWLEDKWTGEYMVDLRKRMLDDNATLPECSECSSIEKSGGKSDRIKMNEKYLDDLIPNIETGNQYNKPTYWDLRPGNLCNLQCRMCGPPSSSQLNKENTNNEVLKEQYPAEHLYEASLTVPNGCSWSTDNNMNYIQDSLPNTKYIKFLGGEPTIMPEVDRLMDNMISTGISETLPRLHITTNGTNINRKFYDKINKFKNVDITLSIDGTDSTVEYIRHPLNFKKFVSNFKELREETNVSIAFNCAVQPLNLHNMLEFSKWVLENSDSNVNLTFVKVHHPEEHSMHVLPDEYRKYHCEKILSDDIINDPRIKNSGLEGIISRTHEDEFKQELYNKFIIKTALLDITRNQSIKDFIPELWDIIAVDYKTYRYDLKFNKNETKLRPDWILHEKN